MKQTQSLPRDLPFARIRSERGWLSINEIREAWHYKDLFYILVWRDILVWYKQTALGAAWVILQPVAAMVVFTVVFGRLAQLPSDNVPYPLFAYSALVLWSFFSQSLVQSANSLVVNERLVTKIYFPRFLVPTAAVASCLLNMAISCCLLLILMPYYGIAFSRNAWIVAVPVGITIATAMGAGLLLCALNVKYRDMRHVIPFLVQIWMFCSPVVYPASLVPEAWRPVFGLNPLAGAIEGFRWGLFGTPTVPWSLLAVSACSSVLILVLGFVYFHRAEHYFADVI